MARAPLSDEIAAVRATCRALGLGDVAPVLLAAAHHTTLLIPSAAIVARVQSAGPRGVALPRATRELTVARHLARRGAPVVAPLADALAGPHDAGPAVVTLWPYIEHARPAGETDAAIAGATLAAVHRALRDFDDPLPPWTATLERCGAALAGGGLAGADRALLMTHLRRLRHQIEASDSPWVPLHGDAHPGNLLLGPRGAAWIDFEDACRGPLALDVACLPAAAWSAFALDRALVAACADLKSVCVAVWCAADAGRSPEMRDAADYHLQRVRNFAA